MEKSIEINHSDGEEVWKVQMFEIPKHQYMTSIEIIDKEKELNKLEMKLEEAKANTVLEIAKDDTLKNQNTRDAKLTLELAKNLSYSNLKEQITDLQRDIDVLKARNKKYELDFKTVKDSVYYSFRTRELTGMKEAKTAAAQRYEE